MYKFLFVIFFIGSSFHLNAGIESCFKKAPNKSQNHSIRNIDFIYMINLDKRPEKFAAASNELLPYHIFPYRFSAVSGWELTKSDLNELGVKFNSSMKKNLWGTSYPFDDLLPQHEIMHVPGKNYFSHCMYRGAIGIVLSHCSILQDALNSNYQVIWVMEDDIQVFRNPHELSDLIDKLNRLTGSNGWDILFTDPDTKNNKGEYVPCRGFALLPDYDPSNISRFYQEKVLTSDFKKIGARYGAYSMIVSRTGMRKILNFYKNHKIFLPYDMTFYLPDDIQMYGLMYDVVSHKPNSISDNGSPPDKEVHVNQISENGSPI